MEFGGWAISPNTYQVFKFFQRDELEGHASLIARFNTVANEREGK